MSASIRMEIHACKHEYLDKRAAIRLLSLMAPNPGNVEALTSHFPSFQCVADECAAGCIPPRTCRTPPAYPCGLCRRAARMNTHKCCRRGLDERLEHQQQRRLYLVGR